MSVLPAVTFWLGIAALSYTFAGYPWLIALLARKRGVHPEPQPGTTFPDVTVVVVAHNEETRIGARVENLLASDYPREKLRVLVVSDGSTDATISRLHELSSPRLDVVERPLRAGKAAGLNAGAARCAGELVVFTDARQRFAPDTISRLAAHFADPKVGAVSGALEIDRSQSAVGEAVDAYWRLEKRIRAAEARVDSCIGCTGAVYAIRRDLFEPIPDDTILDDVVIPMQIALRGFRVLHDPAALAFDSQPLEPASEQRRKRRTLAGNFQMLFRYPGWLLPWRNRLWWQLASHKYLRILAPAPLALTFLANAALLAIPFYRLAFAAQCALYACAAVGMRFPQLRSPALSLPAGFVFLNLTVLRAFWHYLRSPNLHRWQISRPGA